MFQGEKGRKTAKTQTESALGWGFIGPLPQYSLDFPEEIPEEFRKDPGNTFRFLEFPSRVRLGSPKPYNSRYLRRPEHFQNSLPLSTAGDAFFFRKVVFRRGSLSTGHGIPSPEGPTGHLESGSRKRGLEKRGESSLRFWLFWRLAVI